MKKFICSLAIAAVVIGCSKKETTQATTPGQAPATPATATATGLTAEMPPGHPQMDPAAAGANMGQSPAANAPVRLTGTVAETMDSGGYTYIKVKSSAGEQWVAVQQTTVKKGQTISILPQMTAENFKSSTLNRTFDRIVFGSVEGSQMAGAPAGMPPMGGAMGANASAHMSGGAAAIGDVNVPKAEGASGKTIAEVWQLRPTLKGQSVSVRGKVVKFLPGIMGRNWMHIRDGSGTADKGDNDLTVTTSESAKVGDVITVSGKVAVDKDFGAGYKYSVILEEAKIIK